jgi:5-formyltetrahydrofolate cyclo-ligase
VSETANDSPETGVKQRWRAELKAGRAAISAQQRATEAAKLTEAVVGIGAVSSAGGSTVCCYVPFGSEPGSMGLLDALRERGCRVLLPVIPPSVGPLDWSEYSGASGLARGVYLPILEPDGPRLGPRGIGEADAVVVPALGVDRLGVRLGKGAGYYDRSLVFAAPEAQLIAVVRDEELVDRLPAEPHDVRMTAALTPGHGVVALDRATEV